MTWGYIGAHCSGYDRWMLSKTSVKIRQAIHADEVYYSQRQKKKLRRKITRLTSDIGKLVFEMDLNRLDKTWAAGVQMVSQLSLADWDNARRIAEPSDVEREIMRGVCLAFNRTPEAPLSANPNPKSTIYYYHESSSSSPSSSPSSLN